MNTDETGARQRTASARVETHDEEMVLHLPRLDRVFEQLLPAETRTHLRAAQREQLLAMRSLLDAWISRLDDDQTSGRGRDRRVEIAIE